MIWLENCVITGLQMLMTLRLPGAPAQDTMDVVAEVWIAAFARGRRIGWDEGRDPARIEAAFIACAATTERWPTPGRVLDLLPPRLLTQRALPGPFRPMPPEVRVQLQALLAQLCQPLPRERVPGEADWARVESRLREQRQFLQQLNAGVCDESRDDVAGQ